MRDAQPAQMRILILGGYGFIGAEIARALIADGHEVVGLGRDAALGRRIVRGVKWIGADISKLVRTEAWMQHLEGVTVIVNAAGALQDGARDRLKGVHDDGVAALIAAAERAGVRRFIQISAPGARADASTEFLRSKARGDSALRASALQWIIFKPGLVIGRNAYGGTALLRMLAAMPLVQVLTHADARIQTVSIDDVADAVRRALANDIPSRADYDLIEDEAHRLKDIVSKMRVWLGFRAPVLAFEIPAFAAAPIALAADMAGALGWRSPLRSTAMKVMSENVLGDPAPWRGAGGRANASLDEFLHANPATAQERHYARAQLALPLVIVTLGLYWIASGAIGLLKLTEASAHLEAAVGGAGAKALVASASFLDLGVGAAVLVRKTSRPAVLLSIAVAAVYLIAGTLIEPALWLDPLGVYVKVLPAMALGVVAALLIGER
ncbi:MAG: SDR family oxidoreductase [Parvularculaceae bacterium]